MEGPVVDGKPTVIYQVSDTKWLNKDTLEPLRLDMGDATASTRVGLGSFRVQVMEYCEAHVPAYKGKIHENTRLYVVTLRNGKLCEKVERTEGLYKFIQNAKATSTKKNADAGTTDKSLRIALTVIGKDDAVSAWRMDSISDAEDDAFSSQPDTVH